MAEPPKSPPSSDIEGVNRDARVGKTHDQSHPDAGQQLGDAKSGGSARPEESAPDDAGQTGKAPH